VHATQTAYLEGRLGVVDQVLEVCLVPLPGLGRRLVRIVLTAERIVPGRARVARAVRLAAGLDPHEGIRVGRPRGAGGPHAEARAHDVAPVAPLLAQARDGVAPGVDNGLAGHAGGLEQRPERLDVDLLVLALVPLRVRGGGELARRQVPCVPAGDVGADAADLLGGAGALVDGSELLGARLWRVC
jgi:hypothetical protein